MPLPGTEVFLAGVPRLWLLRFFAIRIAKGSSSKATTRRLIIGSAISRTDALPLRLLIAHAVNRLNAIRGKAFQNIIASAEV